MPYIIKSYSYWCIHNFSDILLLTSDYPCIFLFVQIDDEKYNPVAQSIFISNLKNTIKLQKYYQIALFAAISILFSVSLIFLFNFFLFSWVLLLFL